MDRGARPQSSGMTSQESVMRIPVTDTDMVWTLLAAVLSGGMLGVLVTLLKG